MKYLLALFLIGCSGDHAKVKEVLTSEGCKDTIVGDWTLWGCDKNDTFVNTFSCRKNEIPVHGVVCAGWFKGYTVRYF